MSNPVEMKHLMMLLNRRLKKADATAHTMRLGTIKHRWDPFYRAGAKWSDVETDDLIASLTGLLNYEKHFFTAMDFAFVAAEHGRTSTAVFKQAVTKVPHLWKHVHVNTF